MVVNYCHAAGGHQTVGSKAEEPVTEKQRVASRGKKNQNAEQILRCMATKRYA